MFFQSIISDVMDVIRAIFLSGDWTTLLIALAAIILAVAMMRRGTQIGSMTLLALVLFAIGSYIHAYFAGPGPIIADGVAAQGNRAVNQLEASWFAFSNLQAGTLLAYFIAFMVMILLLFFVKSVLSRG
jgi:hypothetical protein